MQLNDATVGEKHIKFQEQWSSSSLGSSQQQQCSSFGISTYYSVGVKVFCNPLFFAEVGKWLLFPKETIPLSLDCKQIVFKIVLSHLEHFGKQSQSFHQDSYSFFVGLWKQDTHTCHHFLGEGDWNIKFWMFRECLLFLFLNIRRTHQDDIPFIMGKILF